jgi:hypothetical protein
VDHISAKHKLTWYCLQCCKIGASNNLVTIRLIEGSNQMDYLVVLLDFHDCFDFLSQIIWAYHWQTTTLCTRSMIAFACAWMVVTCSWFGFNAIIVTHLFELTFDFAYITIVKNKKLRSRVTCQPGIIKQILDRCCWRICGFNNFKLASGWIYHCECKQRVCFGWCPYCKWIGPTRSTQTMNRGLYQILLFWVGAAHISCMFAPSLSFDILDKWNINN